MLCNRCAQWGDIPTLATPPFEALPDPPLYPRSSVGESIYIVHKLVQVGTSLMLTVKSSNQVRNSHRSFFRFGVNSVAIAGFGTFSKLTARDVISTAHL